MYFKLGDIFIYLILILLFITGIMFFKNGEIKKVEYLEVYEKSKLLYKYKLTEKRQEIKIMSKLGEEILIIENYKVRKKLATCQGKDCTNYEISKTGQMIICIPNEQLIKLTGEKEDLDFILY